jgi:tetratricopeptide (TPR) repeat protein
LKRGIAFIENNQIPEALDDLNLIISKSHNNSEAFLFKGLAYSKIQNYNEAILSYEQAIKFNTSKKATTKAIYEITKLKIDLGDYYGASYTLERSNSLEVEAKVLDKMKMFTEGSTSIMKKKFKRGIENLTILAKKENLNDQLRPLIYSFRSYGYFSQHKFSNSIHDLNNLIKLGYSLDKACSYNYSLL